MDDMVTLLIVDDEPHARLRISSFALARHGFRIVGEAENGRDALALANALKPDIIVTDILMPVMDGLELLTEVRKMPDAPKVILLTCFDEFSKVQAALRLGASDYLVKIMLKEEDFISVVQKAARTLQKEKQSRHKTIRRTLNEMMLSGSREYVRECAQQLRDLGFWPGRYRFVLLNPDREGLLSVEAHKLSFEDWESDLRCIVTAMPARCWPVLLYEQSGMSESRFEEETRKFCLRILESFRLPNDASEACCKLVLGRPGDDFQYMGQSSDTVHSALKKLFYAGRDECLLEEECPDGFFRNMPGSAFQGIVDRLRANLTAGNGAAAAECLTGWLASLTEEYRPTPEDVKNMASLLVTCIPEHLALRSGDRQSENDSPRIKERIAQATHIMEIHELFLGMAEALKENLKSPDMFLREEIRRSLAFVETHYQEDLTFERVAEHVRLSASWFSKLFRTEVQQTFSDYLASYRIVQAKKLLEESALPIQEIADRIGVPDPHYFSRLFTKCTGQSPKEFRNSARQEKIHL